MTNSNAYKVMARNVKCVKRKGPVQDSEKCYALCVRRKPLEKGSGGSVLAHCHHKETQSAQLC